MKKVGHEHGLSSTPKAAVLVNVRRMDTSQYFCSGILRNNYTVAFEHEPSDRCQFVGECNVMS